MPEKSWAAILLIVGTVAILIGFLLQSVFSLASDNNKKGERIRMAKIEACKGITDEGIRTLCVVEGGRGEGW